MPRTRQTAVDTMPDFTGWTVGNGRYQLLDKLGAGAYGKVHRALDTTSPPENQAYYAIKCLLKHPKGSDKERLQRREIGIHKLVSDHPNVVSYHGCFDDDRYVYVVMGLCTGGDLFGAITEKHLYDGQPEKIKRTFIQILDAIQHCHSLGVYHRDIKPENVMCSSDASMVYLGDFGLSTTSTESREYGCGSSFYMSPECIGPSATGRAAAPYSNRYNDIWGLGVIFTNLITGRNPWRLATPGDACFNAFISNENFLQEVLHLTTGVNEILKGVFRFPDTDRLSVTEVRDRVSVLDAFSKDPNKPSSIEAHLDETSKATSNSSNDTWYSSLGSQYRYGEEIEEASLALVESSAEQPAEASAELLAPPAPPTRSLTVSTPAPAPESDNSDSSGTDGSGGPITPTSNAVDPKVDIPDVSEEMVGHDSAIESKAVGHEVDKPTFVPSTPTQAFKSALLRFRAR